MSDSVYVLAGGFLRGTELLRAGLCEAALVEFRAVYAEAETAGNVDLMAASLCEMAWCCYRLGLAEQGLECAIGAKWLRDRGTDKIELARAMAVKAILLLDLGFSDDAFDLSEEALVLASAGDDMAVLAFALNAKGIVLAVCREVELGLALIERAVSLAADQGNLAAEAYYLLNLGFCHAKIGEEAGKFGDDERAAIEREAAIEVSEQAIERADAGGDSWSLRVALVNTAEMLGLQGRCDIALRYLDRSAALPGDPGVSLRIHHLYTLGDVLQRAGHLHKARAALADALDLADQSHLVDHQVNAAQKLAGVLETLGDTPAALLLHKRFHALYVMQSGETARRRARVEEIRSETRQLRSRAAALADQALSDPLTGIANRRSFDQILNRLAGAPIVLAIVDLDHFKTVNDRFSHIVGDAVLQRVARTLVAQMGPHGHAARLGGEEFVLVFPEAPEATAVAFCEGMRVAIEASQWSDIAPGLDDVTVSIGVASGNGDTPSAHLMQSADNRLYMAKAGGRNRVVSSDGPVAAPAAAMSGERRRWRA